MAEKKLKNYTAEFKEYKVQISLTSRKQFACLDTVEKIEVYKAELTTELENRLENITQTQKG